MHMVVFHSRIAASVTGFFTTDRTFHEKHILAFRTTVFYLFITQVFNDFFRFILNRRTSGCILVANITQVFAITDYFFIAYGNISGCLVSNMYVMVLVTQTAQGSTHWNHIIIRVRTEYDYFLRIRSSTFRTIRVVRIRFTARPSGNGMLDIVEYLNIYIVCRTIQSKQFAQTVLTVIPVGKFQDRFSR